MALLAEELSVWDIAFRWAGYDPDRFLFRYPLDVKDNFKLLMSSVLSGEIFCETLILEKRPPDSKADPKYYIRTHLDDVYACIWGHYYKKHLLKWARVSRGDFKEWCGRRSIPLPEFWFPPGWKENFEWPEYGTRAFWAKHVEPDQEGDFSIRFDIPEQGDSKNFRYLISNHYAEEPPEFVSDSLRPNQLAKLVVQRMATKIWEEDSDNSINITQMARHSVIQKYSGADHYEEGTIIKWIREVAPTHIKGKRGRPRNKSDKDNN